jgi:hypothetical protein
MSQAWVEKTYEAIADEVADELSMLKKIILSEDDYETEPSCDTSTEPTE